MPKFPVDAPIRRVVAALERLGFKVVRQGNHVSMLRQNPDGTTTPLTIPGHSIIKKSTFLDRILHHSTTINIKVNAYRLKKKVKAGLIRRPETEDN